MIISGEVNLITCSTETLVELREAIEVAYSQRIKAITKKSRAGYYSLLSDTEKQIIDSKKRWPTTTAPYLVIEEGDNNTIKPVDAS